MIDRYLGLCMAAGGVKTGFETVLSEVRAGRARLVLVASDASERTKKQLKDKCSYYNVKSVDTGMTGGEIALLIGKRSACAALALTGKGPWKSIQAELEPIPVTEEREDD